MAYVDGFLIVVPKKKVDAYRKIARLAGKVWMELGAVQYVECVGDDLNPSFGTTFPKRVKLKAGEALVFSWILYKNKAARDRINKKVMKDPRLAKLMTPGAMPFDTKRMSTGGFTVLVDA
ncbi:RNA signal recognition particle [Betaproteobacteria bacterium GR16-43]|nr:RNA signal recognition particle [Betaproteobacteria bacterium GR16-43]